MYGRTIIFKSLQQRGLTFDEKWEDENNAVVKVAKEISRKVKEMDEFIKGVGPIVVSINNYIVYTKHCPSHNGIGCL